MNSPCSINLTVFKVLFKPVCESDFSNTSRLSYIYDVSWGVQNTIDSLANLPHQDCNRQMKECTATLITLVCTRSLDLFWNQLEEGLKHKFRVGIEGQKEECWLPIWSSRRVNWLQCGMLSKISLRSAGEIQKNPRVIWCVICLKILGSISRISWMFK